MVKRNEKILNQRYKEIKVSDKKIINRRNKVY